MGILNWLRSRPWVNIAAGFLIVAAVASGFMVFSRAKAVGAAAGPAEVNDSYRVLAPIESGNLLLFPVVRGNGKSGPGAPFLTLDEGLKGGAVEVTEAGKVRGLVRNRDNGPAIWSEHPGDQVNTLVLVNNSKQPLLLLAGEIVTGGKQDRVISKDRIVPPGSDPIDLSVFCIEPGRWVESSAVFSTSSKAPMASFMVQPKVREQAMAGKNQQQVWASVHGSIADVQAAPMPRGGPMVAAAGPPATTSYAKAMQSDSFKEKVDEAAAPLINSRDEIMAQLRKEGAIGVVVAVRGEIVWADIFSSTDLLSRYWTKLVRSYAAESLAPGETHGAPTVADAQRFLEAPNGGTESSEGSVGVYRYRELKSGGTETFVLESLLPEAKGEVHISKLRLRNSEMRSRHEGWVHPMPVQPTRPPIVPPVPVE